MMSNLIVPLLSRSMASAQGLMIPATIRWWLGSQLPTRRVVCCADTGVASAAPVRANAPSSKPLNVIRDSPQSTMLRSGIEPDRPGPVNPPPRDLRSDRNLDRPRHLAGMGHRAQIGGADGRRVF